MSTTTEHPYERYLRLNPPMTADELAQDLAGTNNGYLFAPTGQQLACALKHPERFEVAHRGGDFPYRIYQKGAKP